MGEHNERIPSAGRVGFSDQERMDELRRVGYEVLVAEVDLVDGKGGVLADERVPVLEAGPAGRDERLEQLGFGDLLQVTERGASNVLVWVLQVVSYRVAFQTQSQLLSQ